ncbi:MAG: hypothetical protein P8178_12490 [Candidatus Thiodiazotropha sp.]
MAFQKSEQLILSLKDNIVLLRNQLEQTQNQLAEARRTPPAPPPAPVGEAPPAVAPEVGEGPNSISQPSEPLDSNLLFDGFPSSERVLPREKAPVVRIFPEKSPPVPPLAPATSSAAVRVSDNDTPKVDLSIPVYRVENERPPLPRERRPLSPFTIAMLILAVMLALGGGAIYRYMQETSDNVAGLETDVPKASKPGNPVAKAEPAAVEAEAPAPKSQWEIATPASAMSVLPQAPDALSEEAKLEAELTLRQMAEEDFRRQLQQINETQIHQPVAAPETAPSAMDEAAAAAEATDNGAAPQTADPVPAAATTELSAPEATEDTAPVTATPDS